MSSYAVTGASRGLGLEFVRQLAANEENMVFALVRDPVGSIKLLKLAEALPNLAIIKLNITSPEDWKAAAATVSKATGGPLDVLIHNATTTSGTTATGTAWVGRDHSEDLKAEVLQCVNDNVLSQIDGNNAFLPLILKGQEKRVVSINSVLGLPENVLLAEEPRAMAYSISKAALNMLVAKYAAELKPQGVKFLSLSPGWVKTHDDPAQDKLDLEMVKIFRKIHPELKGRVSPEDAVRDCLKVIANFDWDANGRMISHLGNQKWFTT